MSDHLTKSIAMADKITSMAEDALRPLDMSISHWPGEFRSIIWTAVAEIAYRRSETAKNET